MQERTDFRAGHHGRKPRRALGADEILELRERLLEDVAVEKEKGAESLVLRGSGDMVPDREGREEGVDLGLSHFGGVPLVVKEDEALDPADVGLFGAQGVVARADGDAHAVEELRLPGLAGSGAGKWRHDGDGISRHFVLFSGCRSWSSSRVHPRLAIASETTADRAAMSFWRMAPRW